MCWGALVDQNFPESYMWKFSGKRVGSMSFGTTFCFMLLVCIVVVAVCVLLLVVGVVSMSVTA